jgi:hypothetical protein
MLRKIGKMTPRCPKWLPCDEYTVESQLPCDEYIGSRLLCVLWTSIRTALQKTSWWIIVQGVKTPQCTVLITGESRVPSVFCTSRVLLQTNLGWLPSGEYTRESIANTNNSSNIREKNWKSFLDMPNGTRISCLLKKWVKKPHDTVPFSEPGCMQIIWRIGLCRGEWLEIWISGIGC